MSVLIRNGLILTMNDAFEIIEGDLSIRNGTIAAIGGLIGGHHDTTIDARGGYVLPGFIQTHVHLCQTIFRGYADDRPLMQWLRTRTWPMEAAHTPASLTAAARLATTELLLGGTTTILTMETVHDTDAIFEAVAASGMRATIGKCMMDDSSTVPERLREHTEDSIAESLALQRRWDGAEGGRIRAAFAPRFAVSCSRELLEAVGALSRQARTLVHTHASESREEIALIRQRSGGLENIAYFAAVGLASPHLCAAHCVWVDDREQGLLAEHDIKVMHCPSSNMKLGSGMAPVPDLLARGITVSLGADGASCNNRLDMFEEMRLSALIQAVRRVPGALPARAVVTMATRGGAKTLGLDDQIGSLEVGKLADVIVVDRDRPHLAPGPDPYSTLVYAARASDVRATLVGGELLVRDGLATRVDSGEVARRAREEAAKLAARAGISLPHV
ncbi:MAG: 5'-deoxyadenosine deaminase [Vicinamibacterales bacterium]